MKTTPITLALAGALALTAVGAGVALADRDARGERGGWHGGGEHGQMMGRGGEMGEHGGWWRGAEGRGPMAGQSGPRGMGRAMMLMETYDTDGDGALTQEEIDTARAEQLRRFDTDGDGALTLEEYQALWLDAMHERMVDRFQQHDDDGSGTVTVEEFNEEFRNLVSRADRNGDGRLDAGDMGQAMRRGPAAPAMPTPEADGDDQ